jgi:hypothetical protein
MQVFLVECMARNQTANTKSFLDGLGRLQFHPVENPLGHQFVTGHLGIATLGLQSRIVQCLADVVVELVAIGSLKASVHRYVQRLQQSCQIRRNQQHKDIVTLQSFLVEKRDMTSVGIDDICR